MRAARHPVAVLVSVVEALAFRELKTRFGRYRLGFLWALADPALHVVLLTIIFSVRGRQALPGVEFPLFILTGIIPFLVFSRCLSQAVGAMSANSGLLVYRQILPFDFYLTRWLLEVVIATLTFLVLLAVAAWLGLEVLPHDPLTAIGVMAVFGLFCFGVTLTAGVACEAASRDLRKLLPVFSRPLYFISGVFFPLAVIPERYHHWLDWNPILHALELFRGAWFEAFPGQYGSWNLLLTWTIGALGLGCLLYRRHRDRLGTEP